MHLIVLCGLPGAGKSYIADRLEAQYGCHVVRKADLCQQAHRNSGSFLQDWRQWLDLQYKEQPLEELTTLLLDPFFRQKDALWRRVVVFDSVHNLLEWRLIKHEMYGCLVCVTAPFPNRFHRTGESEDFGQREGDRIEYAHTPRESRGCLFARAEWSLFSSSDYPATLDLCIRDLYSSCKIGFK